MVFYIFCLCMVGYILDVFRPKVLKGSDFYLINVLGHMETL